MLTSPKLNHKPRTSIYHITKANPPIYNTKDTPSALTSFPPPPPACNYTSLSEASSQPRKNALNTPSCVTTVTGRYNKGKAASNVWIREKSWSQPTRRRRRRRRRARMTNRGCKLSFAEKLYGLHV